MEIYWVRHGQAEFRGSTSLDADAVDEVFNQTRDPGLSERGWREAEQVARRFEASPVDAVYTSPRARARETARPTCEALGLEATIVEGVTELRTGRLDTTRVEGRVLQALRQTTLLPESTRRKVAGAAQVPIYYAAWRAGRTLSGEPRAAFEARLSAAIEAIAGAHPADAKVAVFAHGYVIFYLSSMLSRWSRRRVEALTRPYVPNGSITRTRVLPGQPPSVLAYADVSHLRGAGGP